MTSTVTIDIETTIRNTIGKNKASAFCVDNKVVLLGIKNSWEAEVRTHPDVSITLASPDQVDVVIGQNFKFDIQYIRRDNLGLYNQLIDINWWDTSVAEYILTAQQTKYASLDKLAEKYGGTLKDDKIKEYWSNGVDTTEIPISLLTEYCKHDVLNTELVARKQMDLAKARGQYDLIILMSNASKAYADMEYNGMHIDTDKLNRTKQQLEFQQQGILGRLQRIVRNHYPDVPEQVWNLSSNQQLSALMFGGEIKWSYMEVIGTKNVTRNIEQVPCGVIKSGKNKGQTKLVWLKETVTVDDKVRITGSKPVNLLRIKPKQEWGNANGYATGDDVMSTIYKKLKSLTKPPALPIEFIELILELRKLSKLISTYCEQLSGLVYPDGRVHHNLNNVATDTSRLSSSNPNCQNIPAGPIKDMFVSRFGADGMIVQVDYSQLEVVWQAFVSGDRNLKKGIIEGIDFHCARLAKKEGVPYEEVVRLCKVEEDPVWVMKRKNIKVFTFQRAYGAGAKAIAASTGMPKYEVEALIKNELEMYPQVEKHFEHVRAAAKRNSAAMSDGEMVGFYQSLTKRAYAYKYYENTFNKNNEKSMSPTQLRNYDIQGGATGDLVPAYVYHLFMRVHHSKNKDKVFIINTIHDSIMLDIHKDLLYGVCTVLKDCMQDVSVLKNSLGIDFDIPLKVDVEYGPCWGDMKSFRPEDFINRQQQEKSNVN